MQNFVARGLSNGLVGLAVSRSRIGAVNKFFSAHKQADVCMTVPCVIQETNGDAQIFNLRGRIIHRRDPYRWY